MTINELTQLFSGLTVTKQRKIAINEIGKYLLDRGYEVSYQLPIVETKDWRSSKNAIDIVAAKDDQVIAIELDNKIPGTNALMKLQGIDSNYTKVILLRNKAYGNRVIGRNLYALGIRTMIF